MLDVELPAPPGEITVVPETVDNLRIVHDDDEIVVVDKPVGVAAHPSPGWTGPTVIGHLAGAGFSISTSGAAERKGIVHRLDVGTSGLMVVAKTEYSYTVLKRAFKERTVKKIYHALVQGHPDPFTGTVDAPIDRHPHHDYKFGVVAGGKPSITHYETLEAFRFATLLEITLETGRTHQIRVHMSAIGHPCCGDLTYGADPVLSERLQLQPPVAARDAPRLRPPGQRRVRRVHVAVPGRPRPGSEPTRRHPVKLYLSSFRLGDHPERLVGLLPPAGTGRGRLQRDRRRRSRGTPGKGRGGAHLAHRTRSPSRRARPPLVLRTRRPLRPGPARATDAVRRPVGPRRQRLRTALRPGRQRCRQGPA